LTVNPIIGLKIIGLYMPKHGMLKKKRRSPKRKKVSLFGIIYLDKQESIHLHGLDWQQKLKGMATKVTGKTAASAASKVLRDGRTSATSKTAAGSALSQRETGGKKK
jgi:hypothetical protein